MEQKTKLETIGPYTPDHPGPFCTRDGRAVRLLTKTDGNGDYPVIGFINNAAYPVVWQGDGGSYYRGLRDEDETDLMNARESPVAREFWVNEYRGGRGFNASGVHLSLMDAQKCSDSPKFLRTIHVREVLPGEGA